jgi:hypothetical protein
MNEGSNQQAAPPVATTVIAPDTEQEHETVKSYRRCLAACLNFTNNTSHTNTYHPSQDELFALTPEHIYAYLANKAYGTPNPGVNARPLAGRCSSLEYGKKAISYFMPNRLMPWNERSKEGNPTRSKIVNELIKRVKKQEVRKQGKKSKVCRPLVDSEFRRVISKLKEEEDGCAHKYSALAFFMFQFHMIARVDDCAKFKLEDLTPCIEYDFCLQSKMCWSKNVLEERDAPEQIVIGSGDPNFCVLLSLGSHLEHAFMTGAFNFDEGFLFGMNKKKAAAIFSDIIGADDFPLVDSTKPVGTHSNRKFASTYARRHGCSRDDVDARGRWKRNRCIYRRLTSVSRCKSGICFVYWWAN